MTSLAVVLSGGAGSRLWPASREDVPKPFLKLPDGMTLLGHTYKRVLDCQSFSELITVTNQRFADRTIREFADLGDASKHHALLLEPEGRDSAPAIAAATLFASTMHGPDTVLCVFPSDHLITRLDAFYGAVSEAISFARAGRIVTFGMAAASPETGYGYIETSGEDVLRFVEKPDAETAKHYVASGNYVWNSGMFCFSAGQMIAELGRQCPALLDAVGDSLTTSAETTDGGARCIALGQAFCDAPKISIDYAIMENAEGLAVVSRDLGWSDIGTWDSYAQTVDPDMSGNRLTGDVIAVDTSDSLVVAEQRLVATVGLDNVFVVETDHAVLVGDRARAQDVRAVAESVKSARPRAGGAPVSNERDWGTAQLLEHGPTHRVRRLQIRANADFRLAPLSGFRRHWILVEGGLKLGFEERYDNLRRGESVSLAGRGDLHVVSGKEAHSVVIEIQTAIDTAAS